MGSFLRVDMCKGTIKKEPVPDQYKNLGGHSLSSALISKETDPTCDPLGPGNKFIVCTGLLCGTPAPSSGRLSVGGKSPLTGGIKEANSGGVVAQKLAKLGIKAIIFEGKPPDGKWYLLKINDEKAELLPANDLVGLNNYALNDVLKERYGSKIGIVSIGVAGERGYRNSSVQVTNTNGYPSRSAARGGMGAVMGSKGIKAIIVEAEGPSIIQYADKEKFMAANKKFIEGILAHPVSGQAMPALGTPVLVNATNSINAMPVNNYSTAGFFPNAEKVSGEYIAELQAKRGRKGSHACNAGCVIKCSSDFLDSEGKYVTSGFEYETIAIFGPNCGIDNIDDIAVMDRMCDDLGVDTMETAATVGVCMDGGKASFGDSKAAIALIQEMYDGTEFGRIMGNGTEFTGKYLHVRRIPTVKSQALAGYDPRGLKGTGVTCATSPMGADHTAGNSIGAPGLDPAKKPGNLEASAGMQISTDTCDSLGICIFSGFCFANPECVMAVADMLTALTGESWNPDRVMGLGLETLKIEKQYNRDAGITPEQDRMPEFMYTDPLEPTGAVFDFSDEELASVVPF